jgi:hypothetical protein
MKNIIIAEILRYIHIVLIIYILIGHIITPKPFLKYYLYLIIFVFLDWNDFDGQCILTKLEHYFRTGEMVNKSAKEEEAPEFFRPLLNNLFNLNLDRESADRLNNYIFMLSFLFGFAKLVENNK